MQTVLAFIIIFGSLVFFHELATFRDELEQNASFIKVGRICYEGRILLPQFQ
ncbi:hypothetical protein UACE39S_01514 [Ureibacillus acetophenoni]